MHPRAKHRHRLALPLAATLAMLLTTLIARPASAATTFFSTRVSVPAATVPADTQSWPTQLTRPGRASCPRGETLIAATGGWTDALGVSHVTYKAAPGLVAVVPPRGLTAGAVTAALMADVGLHASRAASASTRQRLVRQILNLARNQSAPQFCRSRPDRDMLDSKQIQVTKPADGSLANNSVVTNSNWAGYATTYTEHGSLISGADGSWTVPRHTSGLAPSVESTWVGIGGGLGGETAGTGLIQTGTSMQTNEGYRSWYEWIGTRGCTGFCGKYSAINAISPGDSISGTVYWSSSTQACFQLTDFSRGTGSWDVCGGVSGIPFDRTSAEWVNENHYSDGYYYDNPHTVSWTGMLITNSTGGGGTLTSPFSTPYEAVIADNPFGTGNGDIPCNKGPNFLSYPVNAATNSSGAGTSQIVTCYIPGVDSP